MAQGKSGSAIGSRWSALGGARFAGGWGRMSDGKSMSGTDGFDGCRLQGARGRAEVRVGTSWEAGGGGGVIRAWCAIRAWTTSHQLSHRHPAVGPGTHCPNGPPRPHSATAPFCSLCCFRAQQQALRGHNIGGSWTRPGYDDMSIINRLLLPSIMMVAIRVASRV